MTTDSVVSEPAGGWREPWPQVFELATALPVDRWALVGGLMVEAHALAASIDTTRVTIDVDAARASPTDSDGARRWSTSWCPITTGRVRATQVGELCRYPEAHKRWTGWR